MAFIYENVVRKNTNKNKRIPKEVSLHRHYDRN